MATACLPNTIYLVDQHEARQVAPLVLPHPRQGVGCVPLALLRVAANVLGGPAFQRVFRYHQVARVAAVAFVLFGPVTASAIVGRQLKRFVFNDIGFLREPR